MARSNAAGEREASHWGRYASTSALPNASAADVQTNHLAEGDLAYVIGGGMYVCTSPLQGAATWESVAQGDGTVTGNLAVSGSVTATTTVTAGTGVVATTGGVTATAGGLTATAGGLTVTAGNAVVTAGNLTVTAGTTTLGGGLVATTLGKISNIPVGAVAYGSLGTNAVHVAGTLYYSSIWLPANKTLTGIGVLNGDVVGTHKLIFALANSAGTVVANSALAGALSAGADAFQEIAFTGTYAAVGPARYWIIVQCEGTTPKTRRIAASTYLNFTGSAAGSFGTIPSITPPTTTAADVGPIAYVY